jgi:hypothetical protein
MKKERQTCVMNRAAQRSDKLSVSGSVVVIRLATNPNRVLSVCPITSGRFVYYASGGDSKNQYI